MVRAIAAIANGGVLLRPHVRMESDSAHVGSVDISEDDLKIVREGMRQGVLEGTGSALNVPYVDVATKSGTAELGSSKANVNSWITGFFPYDNPRYAFATVMEKGPATNLVGSAFVMRQLFDWMSVHTPEYFE